jgi:hypothetical protein
MCLRSLKIPRRINLRRPDRLHSNLARRRPKLTGRGGTFALQHQSTLFLQKLCLLAAQLLAFVTILNRSKVLSRRENEPAGENETTNKQERQTQKSAHVSLAVHCVVSLVRG